MASRIPRRTTGAPFERVGRGVHTGERGLITVTPAAWGDGVVLRARDRPRDRVEAQLEYASSRGGGTDLSLGALRVRTVEHLLAALYGIGITDASIDVHGPEVPILDGSAAGWIEQLAGAGLVHGPPALVLEVLRPVRVERFGGWAEITPCERAEVAVEVDFDDHPIHGRAETVLGGEEFVRDVCWARTFALERDVGRLRDAGRGRGATPDNTVVIGRRGPVPPAKLRAPDEPVRHKLLDAIGDLALLGVPLRGRLVVFRGSHRLHHALLHALIDDELAWREVETG